MRRLLDTRILLVALFVLNLSGWLWIAVIVSGGAQVGDPTLLDVDVPDVAAKELAALNAPPDAEPRAKFEAQRRLMEKHQQPEFKALSRLQVQAELQLQAGRSFRDSASRFQRYLSIAGWVLVVNAMAILGLAVVRETRLASPHPSPLPEGEGA